MAGADSRYMPHPLIGRRALGDNSLFSASSNTRLKTIEMPTPRNSLSMKGLIFIQEDIGTTEIALQGFGDKRVQIAKFPLHISTIKLWIRSLPKAGRDSQLAWTRRHFPSFPPSLFSCIFVLIITLVDDQSMKIAVA